MQAFMTEYYVESDNMPIEIVQNEDEDIYALINQPIFNTNNKSLILHHKDFRAVLSAVRILVLREF